MHGVTGKCGLGLDLSDSQTRLPCPCSGPPGSPRDSSETGFPNPGPVRERKPKHSEASSVFSPEHSRLYCAAFPFLSSCEFLVIRGKRYRKMGCRKTFTGKVSAMDVCVTMCREIVGPQGGQSRDQRGFCLFPWSRGPPPYVN